MNPPAFPMDFTVLNERHINEGMSLRDYFAAKAMPAVILRHEASDGFIALGVIAWPRQVLVADSMLKAREVQS